MLPAVRAVVLAGLLFLPSHGRAIAVQTTTDSAGLEFLGFRAGARLEELTLRLRSSGGSLHCRRSKADSRVSECRATLREADEGVRIDVWVSAIDSLAGVMTLSGKVDSTQLGDWRQTLEQRYGRVAMKVQGTQRMLQWVRRGRMIRLTWRLERNTKVTSVSLVDGHVLDSWGRAAAAEQRQTSPKHPAQPPTRTR
jgi:hypothetical protein